MWTLVLAIGKLQLFRVAMALLKLQEKDLLKMQFEGNWKKIRWSDVDLSVARNHSEIEERSHSG